MGQELSDAEWLRWLADDTAGELKSPEIARLRSIADRLERPGVIHEDELPEALPLTDELYATSYVPGGVGCRVYPVAAVHEAAYKHIRLQSDLLRRIGSVTGDHPLPTCEGI